MDILMSKKILNIINISNNLSNISCLCLCLPKINYLVIKDGNKNE